MRIPGSRFSSGSVIGCMEHLTAVPKDVVERLNKSIVEALRSPTVSAGLEGLVLTVIADKPEEFGALITKDAARMQES